MTEYMVLGYEDRCFIDTDSLQAKLNALACEGWAVVTSCISGIILSRFADTRVLAEDVLRRQFTFSFDYGNDTNRVG